MKLFQELQLREALAYAAAGNQALHVHQIIVNRAKAPRCFVREVDAGRDIAHLFDQDRHRLEETARALGVRVIVVERVGEYGQHVDLCAGPLRKALRFCKDSADDTPDLFDLDARRKG